MNLTNTQFVFKTRTKTFLLGGMVLGVLCLALSAWGDDAQYTRFWTNYLHNSIYFTGIAFMSMFFLSAQITAFAGWNSVVKRVWEAMSQFMWVGLVLLAVLVIGVWGHFHHLYLWNEPGIAAADRIIRGKESFLNPGFYTLALIGFLFVWFFWAYKLRSLSVAQDSEANGLANYKKQRKWAASFLPLAGFLSTVFLWQSVMSIDPHWYSTMFAWYSMVSMWLGAISMTIMLIIYLKSQGYMQYVTQDHLHDIGKYLFGISVFWTYLWFDQYMLIWYSNNGEETIYFRERMDHYAVLFWGNLLLNFITPFFILMRNDTKRKYGTLFFAALIVFFGHWWDYFYMIKPGARMTMHEAKEIFERQEKRDEAKKARTMTIAQPMEHAAEAHAAHAVATTHPAGEAPMHTAQEEVAAQEPAAGTENEKIVEPVKGETAEKAPETTPTDTKVVEASTTPEITEEQGGAHGEGEHGGEHAGADKSFKLGFTIPGLEEIGILIGFLSLFLFFFFNQLAKVSLVPWKDPFLEESLHHETGAMIEGEQKDNAH